MTTNLYTFAVKTEGQVRDDYLRVYSNGLILQCGISNPNILPGSDEYVRATALGLEIAPLYANLQILGNQLMSDTAQGTYLVRIGGSIGLSIRPASGSYGYVVLNSSASSLVVTGAQLTDSAGLRYAVTTGGTYANGSLIPIAAVDTGSATNHAAGDSLRWQSAPPYSAATALVANLGLTNGSDVEDQETFRTRVQGRQANPGGGGQWQSIATTAELSHPSVQKSFVYPAILGPSTVMVAVSAAPTATSKSRVVNSTVVSNIITGYIAGTLPEHVYLVVYSTIDNPVDVSVAMSIPSAPTASPPGPGGGWIDGTPWPPSAAQAVVSSVGSPNVFTVAATASPSVGTHIAWLSTINWQIYSGTVTLVTGTTGAWVVTTDTPFTGITSSSLLWPQSTNQAAYIAAILAHFALMGPYEVTTNPSALVRGFRHPPPNQSWPSTLTSSLFDSVLRAAGNEVSGTAVVLGLNSHPTNPADGSAPWVFVPRNIGVYPA